MKKKTKAILLQAPALILLIASAVGSWFIKFGDFGYEITLATPILLTAIVILYFWGRRVANRNNYY